MKYELIELKWITERGNIALIKRGEKHQEYAVVRNLDVEEPFESDSQWDCTIEYYPLGIEGLQKAVECFRRKSEYEYISRSRLEEIATKFKDRLSELNCDMLDEDAEYGTFDYDTLVFMAEELELTDIECDYFGIDKNQFKHNDLEIKEV